MNVDTEREANLALLCGEVAGALSIHFPEARLEMGEDGNYTGRTLISRPSGIWAVSVAFEREHEEAP